MFIHDFSLQNSILNHFIAEIRDIQIQKDSERFRKNLERINQILSYELSKHLNYSSKTIETPLEPTEVFEVSDKIVICSVLRAGLTAHNGLLHYFDKAESAFISAVRHHNTKENKFKVDVEYLSAPDLNGKILIIVDPMLATGSSLKNVYEILETRGKAKEIHIVATIAAPEGIKFLEDTLPKNTHLWVAQVDRELNSKGYIVPGLGDAGDLAYGKKM